MITKSDIIDKALSLGFGDIGFTTTEPFEAQREILIERNESYAWVKPLGIDLVQGTDPKLVWPGAKSIIILVEDFFREAFPTYMEQHFGRFYLDDDRVIQKRYLVRLNNFMDFLLKHGIDVKPTHETYDIPHRIAAARAGLGTFGKNSLLYGNRVGLGCSWILFIPLMIDRAFEPDEPSMEVGCPEWCKNVCITSCPTGALRGPRHLDPRKCISYLSYLADGLTPLELREPMGLWVYGCDRCQNVCPRNAPWLAKQLPVNTKVEAMVEDFALPKLLSMDVKYFKTAVFPHMFYMPEEDIWRWQINTARVMGNSLDERYVPNLKQAFEENPDSRVRSMAAWAVGRIGGVEAKKTLEILKNRSDGEVGNEIDQALSMCN